MPVATLDGPLHDAATPVCSLRVDCRPLVERQEARPALLGIIPEVILRLAAVQPR